MSTAQISPEEVESREEVGKVDGDPVYHLACRGGLQIVALKHKSGQSEILGAAGHPAIAMHIARRLIQNQRKKATWIKLAKADYPLESFAPHLPRWERVTDALRARQGY